MRHRRLRQEQKAWDADGFIATAMSKTLPNYVGDRPVEEPMFSTATPAAFAG